MNLGPVVNSAFQDFAPNLSRDGHWLYFHSARPTWLAGDGVTQISGSGGVDLYVSHRAEAPFIARCRKMNGTAPVVAAYRAEQEDGNAQIKG